MIETPPSSGSGCPRDELASLEQQLLRWKAERRALFECLRKMENPFLNPEERMQRHERARKAERDALARGDSDPAIVSVISDRVRSTAEGLDETRLTLAFIDAIIQVDALQSRLTAARMLDENDHPSIGGAPPVTVEAPPQTTVEDAPLTESRFRSIFREELRAMLSEARPQVQPDHGDDTAPLRQKQGAGERSIDLESLLGMSQRRHVGTHQERARTNAEESSDASRS